MTLATAGVSKIDIAGPGFMNFWIDAARIASGLTDILTADDSYGRSSNPTCPPRPLRRPLPPTSRCAASWRDSGSRTPGTAANPTATDWTSPG